MKRRSMLLLPLAIPAITACYYPEFFYTSWDEEVLLHDGTIIVVKFKFKFERRSQFKEFDDIMLRDTAITFDSGPPFGIVTQEFRRMQPVLLNKYEGIWYGVIVPRGAGRDFNLTGQDWGPQQNPTNQTPVKLNANGFKFIRLSEFPDAILQTNVLYIYSMQEMAERNGQLLQLNGVKADLAKKHIIPPEKRLLFKHKPAAK